MRILHLSDLHFNKLTNVNSQVLALLNDLNSFEMHYQRINYLVISGDFVDRGDNESFSIAREFISALRVGLKINSIQQVILAPGNHDVVDNDDFYRWTRSPAKLREGTFVPMGQGYLSRRDDSWPKRFEPFSKDLYEPLYLKPYPLNPSQQCDSLVDSEQRIQFLTLNSAWEIDHTDRKRSSLNEEALLNGIRSADEQLSLFGENKSILRVAVWHHALLHKESLRNTNTISHLVKAGVKLVLHGDVHEANLSLDPFQWPGLVVLGVGAFGAKWSDRPESTPLMYNLIELWRSKPGNQLDSMRIRTRIRPKLDGAWTSGDVWTNPHGPGKISTFEIDLPTGRPKSFRRKV